MTTCWCRTQKLADYAGRKGSVGGLHIMLHLIVHLSATRCVFGHVGLSLGGVVIGHNTAPRRGKG